MDENMQLKRMDEYDHTNEWLNLWMDGCPGGHQVAGKERRESARTVPTILSNVAVLHNGTEAWVIYSMQNCTRAI